MIQTKSKNPVILKKEIMLKEDSDNYSEVRHIVLKGTNGEIGKAWGRSPRRTTMSSQAAMLIIYMPKFTWPACRSTILPYTRG
jgi:hypothetical protein